jgi:hypothetical protein
VSPATAPPDPNLCNAALTAAARGWHVFPLAPGSKRPAVGVWEARATTDSDRVHACWTTGAFGIGVACGPSGLLVVDLDVAKPGTTPPEPWQRPGVADGRDVLAALCEDASQPWPDTHTVATASGGLHLYFRQPAGAQMRNTHGRLGWLIDTRGHGGYVVAPGTVLAGRAYTVVDDTEPADLPRWLADQLTTTPPIQLTKPPSVQLRGEHTAYVRAALDNQVRHVHAAVTGRRNFTVYMAAQNLGQLVASGMVDQATVRTALLAAAETHVGIDGFTHRETANAITSGLRAGARRPRQVNAA